MKHYMLTFLSSAFLFYPICAYNPSHSAIAWDLHKTLLKRDTRVTLSRVYHTIKMHSHPFKLIIKVPSILYTAYHVAKEAVTHDQFLNMLCEQHPLLDEVKPQLKRAISSYVLAPGAQQLVQKLHNAGYTQIIASNIHLTSLDELKTEYPDFFALFDGELIPFYHAQQKKLIGKPQLAYFIHLAQYVHKKYAFVDTIVFIDDQEKNSRACLQTNDTPELQAIGITFSTFLAQPISAFYDTVAHALMP
ncbi:MAG: hypothetical protein WCE21_02945 [Candidatus Babeliales bacterium]